MAGKKRPNDMFRLGEKISRIRRERGLTIKELAKMAGLSQSLISQIEKNQVTPSIASLLKISRVLNVRMSYFFEEAETEADFIVVEKKDRKITFREGSKYGHIYETLAKSPKVQDLDPLLVTLRPAPKGGRNYFSHQGQEFIYVLEGRIELFAGDKKVILGPGDSAYLDSKVFHGGHSLGSEKARVLSVRYLKD